ncbi:hypothetical protein ACLMJK_006581 [Lecanora helva]
MPPSSDQPLSYEHSAVDPALCPQEEPPRKRSPGRKGQGKKARRHETVGENAEERRASGAVARPISPPATSNGVSSPLLEAWEPTLDKPNNAVPAIHHDDWIQDPSFGGSPPQHPSSRLSPTGSPPRNQAPLEELRGGFTHTSPPTSPRAAFRQPAQRVSDYQSFGDYLGSSPNSRRPFSVQSQNAHYPPPPHHPQAHFYGAPQIDFGLTKPNLGDSRSDEVCCCILDSLPAAGQDGAGHPDNVLLVGFDHSLDVYHLDKKRFDRIGRLSGLRGSVIGAKILPCQPMAGLQGCQPLVAVTVHGPYLPLENLSQPEPSHREDEDFEASNSMIQAMQVADTPSFQTTIEIYSLRTGKHIANLFRSPKVEVRLVYDGQMLKPPPIGDLKIYTHARFLIVSSGSSGEVFMFQNNISDASEDSRPYKCIGKTWTRTSTATSGHASTPSNESDPGNPREPNGRRTNAAILALSDRWLVVVPPPSSSYTTLHGKVDLAAANAKIPGLSSHTPPTEPQTTCDLDTPKDASMLNRVARDVAQGALKSAQWVASEGVQAWNNYWSKPSDLNRPAGSPPNQGFAAQLPPPQTFPPTHAQDNFNDRAKGQASVVSIIDLARLSQNQHAKPSLALQPLAAFSLPLGCSFLSFSPSGLNLLSASSKGDVQHIWDLMRMVHGESGHVGDPDTAPKGPSVRQVARFSRMTEARIIDVIWTEPKGERFAIVTERGTVHINDLPPSAFQWPPLRRRLPTVSTADQEKKAGDKQGDAARPQSTGSTFGSAFGMFTGKTQTALAAVRGRSPSATSGFPGFGSLAMTAGASAKGGKAVAAGINRSVSAAAAGTVSTIRHYGENRVALPPSSNPVSPGCARWMHGKSQGALAVTGGGTIRIHSIRQSTDPKARQRRPSVLADRPVEFSLPKGKSPTQYDVHDKVAPKSESSALPGSFWLPQSSRPTSRKSNLDTHPLSYAEIETNAPYQPFHTDRRVNLFIYSEDGASNDPHHLDSSTPWAFGEEIPATKISAGSTTNSGGQAGNSDPAGAEVMENEIRMEGDVDEGQRIVSTTTRRKKGKQGGDGVALAGVDGEFFEDDCEVLDYAEDRV